MLLLDKPKPREKYIRIVFKRMIIGTVVIYNVNFETVYELVFKVFLNHPDDVFRKGKGRGSFRLLVREEPKREEGFFGDIKFKILHGITPEEAYQYFMENFKKYTK